MADNDIPRDATSHDRAPAFDTVAEAGAGDGLGLPPFLTALLRQASADASGSASMRRALPQRPFFDWPDDAPEGNK